MASSELEVKPIIVIDDDNIPRFSGITDSNSPLEKEKPTKVKIERRQCLCKVRDNDSDDKRVVVDEPNFVDIADFDSPLKVKIEGRRRLSIVSTQDNDSDDRRVVVDESNIVDIADFDLPSKVKIEGRLSLSTGSTQENNSDVKRVVLDKPNFVDIAEFDSPLKVKIEGRQSLSIVSTRDNDSDDRIMVLDEPNFVDIAEFDSSLKVKTEGRWSLSIVSTRDDDSDDRRMVLDEPNFVDIAEFDSPLKVKTEGRRSLSIVSTRDDDSDDRRMVLDEPNFVDIAEFDSPLKVKTEGKRSLSIVSTRDNDSNDRRMVLHEPNFVDIAEFDLPLKVKTEGSRSLSIISTRDDYSDDRRMVLDEPNFVDIAEFDLPLKVKTEGRRSLSIVSTQDDDRRAVLDEPNFVDIPEFDSPLMVKIKGRRHLSIVSTRDNDSDYRRAVLDEPNFVDIAEFDSPLKVKIEGRRSLSIVSTQDNDSDDRRMVLDEPNFVDIADFDLPQPKHVVKGGHENGGGNENKDVLNDLLLFYWIVFLNVFEEKEKPMKVKTEGRQCLSKVSTQDNDSADNKPVLSEPNFVDIADFDLPPPKNVIEGGCENGVGDEIKDILNVLLLFYWSIFLNVFVEKEKLTKVKIEGRQCLCKVLTLDNDSDDKRVVLNEPDFVDVADLDFPPPKNVVESGGENEIKDILNDLGGTCDFLSIEKKRALKRIGPSEDCVKLVKNRKMSEVEKADLPEYPSVGSLFLASDMLDPSLDVIKTLENVVEEQEEKSDLWNVSTGNGVHKVNNIDERLNRNEPKNLFSKGLPFMSEVKEEEVNYLHIDMEDDDDDENDCVALSGKRMIKEVERKGSKSKDEYDDSDGVNVLDDFVAENDNSITMNSPNSTYKFPYKIAKMLYPNQCDGLRLPEYVSAGSLFPHAFDTLESSFDLIKRAEGRVENVVKEQEKKSDLCNIFEGNKVHGVKNDSERLNRNEPKKVSKKLMSKGLPFVFEVTEEDVTHLHIDLGDDEDEDDCVVLSGKRMVEEIERQETKSKDECADSDGVDVLDDYTDGFVEENDGNITLNGPKSTYKLPGKIAKMQYPHQCDGLRMREYVSAGSSFLPTSDMLDSSSNMIKKVGGRVRNVVEKQKGKSDLLNVFEVNRVLGVKNEGERLKINEPKKVDEKLMSKGQPFVSKVKEEEVNYLHIDSKGDKFVGRVLGTKKHGEEYKPQPERVDKKLVPIEQSLVSKVEERMDDDDEDACVILSGKRTVKDVKREGSKCKEEYDDLDGVDVLDDYTDDSVAENDCSITLDGPKSTYKLPGKIAKMLYPHQCDGLRWLWSLHCQGKGGILGDDMGLGKTMQICGFLAGLFHSRLINRVLVVAPKTLLPHWIKELSVVGLYDNIREYYGACPKARQYELQYILQDKGVLLTTYDIVRNNSKSLRGGYDFDDEGSEDSVTWDYMILDEGHFIKNPSTQRAKSLLEIPSAHRIIISGTPLQNNLKELWALVNFCCPDLLGDNKWFKEKFECAILRGNEKEASDIEKHIGSEVAKELREHIQPYFLRRLKNEVFDEEDSKTIAKLSKKNEVIVWLRLNSCQRQLYETFLKSELVLSAFGGSPLAAITILKKICDDPLLLTKRAAAAVLEGMESMLKPEDVNVAEKLAMHIADVADTDDLEEKHDSVSCKISFILSLLDNLIQEGRCVLIFSQTRKMLNLIQNSIVSKGYEFLRIDGTTKAGDRVKIVNDFQKGVGASIFLLTSRVGGLGLTLTRADRVIVVDPAWNPSTDNQSVDRAYRIGQTKDVIVYRLMTCGTVEEKIYRKQIFKGGLFKTATEHKEQIRYFSKQDLRDLFSLPEQGFDVSVTQKQLHKEHDCHHIMDDYLKAHIEFLQTQGIAGVSHHSLLFSKAEPVQVVKEEEEVTAPVQVVKEEDEEISKKGTTFVGCLPSSSSLECIVDGAAYDFKPKDVSMNKKRCSLDSGSNLTKFEIEEKINCLSQKLANKGMVSRLPDKGEKLQKQIAQPNFGLFKIRKTERTENTVIDLDD
ncbi:uncharacterized protein LOC126704402 isoform X3 [Quercus robur]|uniref:uncharacterized protein LOC126704402 isoform X3 n=1 Tax=Quercus robur TaxID=38942 RepID=UPI0021627AAD|nr:uncharacterized protein LOC126704402 isoform X3 [Quercus robur]